MNQKLTAHAVVRYDEGVARIEDAIAVVAVVPMQDEAEAEVQRLNGLNSDKRCQYFWVPTRYYPQGRASAD